MSAAADDAGGSAARVSVVSSIGYTAFLAGPPLVGFLADEVGIRRALLVVLAALAVGWLTARSAAPVAAPDPVPDEAPYPAEPPPRPQPERSRTCP